MSTSNCLTEYLKILLANECINKNKQVVLVLDRAGWHTSDQVKVPKGIHLSFLPSHSPELQTARAPLDTDRMNQLLITVLKT